MATEAVDQAVAEEAILMEAGAAVVVLMATAQAEAASEAAEEVAAYGTRARAQREAVVALVAEMAETLPRSTSIMEAMEGLEA